MLVREKVVIDETGPDAEFAKQCERLLGYNMKTFVIADKSRQELVKLMNEMDCRPFTEKSVAEYKQAMINKFTHSPVTIAATVILAIAIVANFVTTFIGIIGFFADQELPKYNPWIGVHASAITWAIAIATFVVGVNFPDQKTASWVRWPIEKYGSQIPEFVLQTAMDLKGHTGSLCKFDLFVDELIVKDSPRALDPFLVAVVGGKDFYLEVWNEPGFKKTRAA